MSPLSTDQRIFTVSEVLQDVKQLMEDAFHSVWIEGEISNLVKHASGHCYFSLKDNGGCLNVVLFRDDFRRLKFEMEHGLKVIVGGRLTLYPPQGKFQLVAFGVEPKGVGARQLAFEQLKAKLEKEGLFDSARKKPIPSVPQSIGILTSINGAALHDILSVLNRRNGSIQVIIFSCSVQGDCAAGEIAETIQLINRQFPTLDVLLVGRGGGSVEDLWAFNEESLARAIAASTIPIISCVGHEVDFTIADFVADLRAPTPSAAAEMVIRAKADLTDHYFHLRQRLLSQMNYLLEHASGRVQDLLLQSPLLHPHDWVQEKMQQVDDLASQVIEKTTHLHQTLETQTLHAMEKLHVLSPLATLSRGYSICWTSPEHNVVKNASEVQKGSSIEVQCREGKIHAQVERTEI